MPSLNKHPIKLTSSATMLYDSVDNYHHNGLEDTSIRMNNHEDLNDFSSQSIVCAMDRFVKAVNNMNETIMVPCRLLDIEISSQKTTTKVPKLLKGGADPYSYYTILNSVKNDLIWGATSDDDDNSNDSTLTLMTPSINNTRWIGQEPKHSLCKKHHPTRRTSTVSIASSNSEVDSEGSSDTSEEYDGSTAGSEEGSTSHVANNVTETLRTHLFGLHSCLKNLTDTATYITDCYQEAVNM